MPWHLSVCVVMRRAVTVMDMEFSLLYLFWYLQLDFVTSRDLGLEGQDLVFRDTLLDP